VGITKDPKITCSLRAAAEILRAVNPKGSSLVVLSPGSSRRQRYKRWPAGHFSRLAALLGSSAGIVPLVAWGPGEEAFVFEVVSACGGRVVKAPPTSLRLLAVVLR
jgi:ADP-heptose:LPS heptosyltransferase